MKKTSLSIPFEDNKLRALQAFAAKKDADLEGELEEAVQKLYEKYVPKDARELVELMAGGGDAKAKGAKKPLPQKQPQPKPDTAMSGGTAGMPAGSGRV